MSGYGRIFSAQRLTRATAASAFMVMLVGGMVPAAADAPSESETPAADTWTSSSRPVTPEVTPGSDRPIAQPQPESAGAKLAAGSTEACSDPNGEGAFGCFAITSDAKQPARAIGEMGAAAGVAPPQWCEQSTGTPLGNRTAVCQVNVGVYTTYKREGSTTTVTGSANLMEINYSYGDTGIPTIAHQIDISAYSGWGEALKGTINAKADTPTRQEEELEGVEDQDLSDCRVESSSFPAKPISPLNSWGTGESFFDSNAIASGANLDSSVG
ncbi:hypothetical protein ACWGH3_39355 [Streptomyces sp. NPDC054884]